MSVITSAKYFQRNIINVTVEMLVRLITGMFPLVSETISLTSAEFGRFSSIYSQYGSAVRVNIPFAMRISFVFHSYFSSVSLFRKTIFANWIFQREILVSQCHIITFKKFFGSYKNICTFRAFRCICSAHFCHDRQLCKWYGFNIDKQSIKCIA